MDFYIGDNLDDLKKIKADLLRGKIIKDFEIRVKNILGEIFECEVSAVPLKEKGKVVQILNFARDITERKMAQEMIADLAKFPSEDPNPVLRVSKDFVIYANQVGEYIFKVKVGNRIPILLRGKINKTFTQFTSSETEVTIDNHVYSLVITPIKETSYANIYGRDITLRKRIENALLESEQQYRLILESMGDIIHVVDRDLKIIYANPAFNKLIRDLNLDEYVVGKTLKEAFPFSSDKSYQEYTQVFNNGVSLITEEFTNMETNEMIVDVRKIPIHKEGKVNQVITIIRDITEQKEAERRLKESEEKYKYLSNEMELILDHIPALIFHKDTNNNFIHVNKFLAEAQNIPKEELVNKSLFDLYPKDEAQAYWDDDMEVVRSGKAKLDIEEPWDIPGGRKWVSTSKIPFINENGEVTGIIGISTDISERKIAEKQLIDSEERFRSIFEQAAVGVALATEEGRFLRINQRFCDIVKYSHDEMVALTFQKITHPDDLEKDLDYVDQLLADDISNFSMEKRYICKDHTLVWVNLTVSLLREISGELQYFIAIVEDITEKKEAEQKLTESEEKFRTITEQSLMGISIDQDNKIKYINEAYSNIFGYTTKEMMNWELNDAIKAIHPDDIKFALEQLSKKQKGEDDITINYQYRGIKKSGDIVWVDQFSKAIIFEGKPADFITLIDITERKIAEEKLKESEEKFRSIADQSLLGIVILQSGFVKYTNRATSLITGYSFQNINNWSINEFYKLFNSEDLPIIKLQLRKRGDSSEETIVQHSYEINTISEELKWVEIFAKPLFYEQKEAFLISIIDITEKKAAENELIKLSNLKSELLTRASHELKTPLIAIKGYADLLLKVHSKKLDDDTITVVEEILDGCERLENLIKDLLETAELESKKIKIKKLEDDLAFLVKFCVRELSGLVNMRNQKIHLELHDKLITYFEKERIYEVISNLVSNAIKYTPPNGLIKIKSEIEDDYYVISIQDNGIGLTPEERGDLFKQFGKIERYGKGWDLGIEGTGMGLYISKKIIELHDGDIWVESEGRNKGSTFYFSLPIIKKK